MPRTWISVALVIALIAYLFAPSYLPSTIVDRLDSTALVLFGLAILPWFAMFVTEFEFFGLKAKMLHIDKKADSAIKEAQDATAAAIEARAAAKAANAAASEASNAASNARELTENLFSIGRGEVEGVHSDLIGLSEEYIETRNRMKPGSERTARMTEIFSRMHHEALKSGQGSIKLSEWLEGDPGRQLAGIAYLRAFPNEVEPRALLSVIENQNQPFVQYWALRVLNNLIDVSDGAKFTLQDKRRSLALENRFPRGTDRHEQAAKINRKLNKSN